MAKRKVIAVEKKEEAIENGGSIVIPSPEIVSLNLRIIGLSSLIINKFSAKAKKQIEDKQQQKATKGRAKRDPDAEFEGSLYKFDDEHGVECYGFPAAGIKKAMITASAQVVDKKKMFLRGAFFVKGSLDGGMMIKIEGTSPHKREDFVRLQGPGRPADIRYRAEFDAGWYSDVTIEFNGRAISHEQLVNLLSVAGFSVGIGDWRPERDGMSGRFNVETIGVSRKMAV